MTCLTLLGAIILMMDCPRVTLPIALSMTNGAMRFLPIFGTADFALTGERT
jgi:hypothetical protein